MSAASVVPVLLLGCTISAVLACSEPRPRPIAYGKESCSRCRMTVSDPRFAGELVTRRGKVYIFDDIECLANFVVTGTVPDDQIHSVWVNDNARPEVRLDATRARYWRNPALQTPMASGVVALPSGPAADSATERWAVESWNQLLQRVAQSGRHRGHAPVSIVADRPAGLSRKPEADVVVDPSGLIRTIGAALRAVPPHGRVRVRPGVYREPRIVIDKPVTIEGEGWPTFVGDSHEVFTVVADSVTLRDLAIRRVQPSSGEDRAGIRFSGVHGCTVENVRLDDTFFGIYLAESSNCRIAGNTIRGYGTVQGLSGNAIHAWNSRALTIEDNELSGHRDGIYLEFTTGSTIRRNRSVRNLRYGLHFMFSHGCEYGDNVFADNNAGVAVMYSDSVTMRHNRFHRNQGTAAYGLLLKEIRDSRIEFNDFGHNTVGVWTEGASRVLVKGNRFESNGWAIRVQGDATDNRFLGNLFAANSFDVGTAPGRSSNVFEGNWWDRYQGYDLDRDGRGDVPFQPVRLFSLLVQEHDPGLILLHSFFISLLDLAERAAPALVPETLQDRRPLMRWPS